MRHVFAFAGQKGGIGKTTAAIGVAAEWQARGLRVLLVDADEQGTARTWAAVAAEQGRGAPTVVGMGAGMHAPAQLPRVAAAFDRVVVDCPGVASSAIVRSALMVAGVAVLPCGASPADAWALGATMQLVRDAQALRPELRACALLTRIAPHTAVGRAARSVVAGAGVDVLEAVLTHRVGYVEALAAGMGPAEYDAGGRCRVEIQRLTEELDALAGVGEEPARVVA